MSSDYTQQQFQQQQFRHKPSDVAQAPTKEAIQERLRTVSRGLIITGALSVVIVVAMIGYGTVYLFSNQTAIQNQMGDYIFGKEAAPPARGNEKMEIERREKREARAQTALTLTMGGGAIVMFSLLACYTFALCGGILMSQLKNYRFCRIACIIAVIPVLSPLVVFGIPFGVTGLTKLSKPDIRKAFN